MDEIIYYAAYGSNLNKQQMYGRCPMAKPISKAVLNGWQLVFRGVADIVPCSDAQVNLGIYSITPECETALDHYESYPNLYIKKHIPIQLKRSQITSMFYVMKPGYGFGRPSKKYLRTIREGYESWKLPKKLLLKSMHHAQIHDGGEAYKSSYWNAVDTEDENYRI